MKKIFSYANLVTIFSLCTLLFSCQKEEKEEKQREALVGYIENTLKMPVDEKDGVYFVLYDTTTTMPITFVQSGDVVEFEYVASSSNGIIFATSIDSIAVKNGLEPLRMGDVQVGAGNLIAGLDRGLQRFALGDHGMILFPFTLGYGERQLGIIPPESALIFEIVVTKLNGVSR